MDKSKREKKDKQKFVEINKTTNFSEWYRKLITSNNLIKNYDISGCYILLPKSYEMWEKIKYYLDFEFKNKSVQNVYFPLLITENNLQKEQNFLSGFKPEVAWVTESGESKLDKKLAIRPTSECAFYPTFSDIIRSYSHLPLKWNQWANVLRWEFSDPTPFIRSREFLWNEGHCAFATEKEAENNAIEMINIYKSLYENLLCVPVISGIKTSDETFAGAVKTYTLEAFIPEAGRAIQCATSHCLGQNFSKMFDIKYLNQENKFNYVWQTSWGVTTRSIGTMLMTHSDDKGLILPSKFSQYHIVIISIYKNKNYEKIDNYCNTIVNYYKSLGFLVFHDSDTNNSPGFKYNKWESLGIPIRFEVGAKEVETSKITVVKRTEFKKKETYDYKLYAESLNDILKNYDRNLYFIAQEKLLKSIKCIENIIQLEKKSNSSNIFCCNLCDNESCIKKIKDLKMKTLCVPDQVSIDKYINNKSENNKCINCSNTKYNICLIGKTF